MSALALVQVATLQIIAESVREYGEGVYIDHYGGDVRRNERDESIKEHFRGLADHLDEAATNLADLISKGET